MNHSFVNISVFLDPASVWCWGSEPVLRKIETYYKDRVQIRFIMGGLIKDIRHFYDAKNEVGGDITRSNRNLAKHWLDPRKSTVCPFKQTGLPSSRKIIRPPGL